MQVVRTESEIADAARGLSRKSLGGVLVPTMGALHEGHAALIRHAVAMARREGRPAGCVVSIFVNPTQFNDSSDFARYPRTLEDDLGVCRAAGASFVFAPPPEVVYPPGRSIPVPPLPGVATRPKLEDAHRQGHFAGVCQVVMRLFDLLHPDAAVFGEKDWQQLRVVHAMTRAAGRDIRIEPHATVREPDGLAMSSRNRFLSADERNRALAISRALREANAAPDPASAEDSLARVLRTAGIEPEYAVVRDAESLEPLGSDWRARPARALIAAMAGGTRLIDNAAWRPGGSGG